MMKKYPLKITRHLLSTAVVFFTIVAGSDNYTDSWFAVTSHQCDSCTDTPHYQSCFSLQIE